MVRGPKGGRVDHRIWAIVKEIFNFGGVSKKITIDREEMLAIYVCMYMFILTLALYEIMAMGLYM